MAETHSARVGGAADQPLVSVIIPCRNEAENLPELLDEVAAAFSGRKHEVVVVDDGSTDGTSALIGDRKRTQPGLRLIRVEPGVGLSGAIEIGLLAARGEIVATMDGDGQNNPAYLPRMVDLVISSGPEVAMCGGQRQKRTDTGAKQLASRFANGLRGRLLNDGARDAGCGLRVLRRETFLRLPFFNGWHRFTAALVRREGKGVVFLDVVDRNRRHGQSKFGILDRALVGSLDLIGVWWLLRRRRRTATVKELN